LHQQTLHCCHCVAGPATLGLLAAAETDATEGEPEWKLVGAQTTLLHTAETLALSKAAVLCLLQAGLAAVVLGAAVAVLRAHSTVGLHHAEARALLLASAGAGAVRAYRRAHAALASKAGGGSLATAGRALPVAAHAGRLLVDAVELAALGALAPEASVASAGTPAALGEAGELRVRRDLHESS